MKMMRQHATRLSFAVLVCGLAACGSHKSVASSELAPACAEPAPLKIEVEPGERSAIVALREGQRDTTQVRRLAEAQGWIKPGDDLRPIIRHYEPALGWLYLSLSPEAVARVRCSLQITSVRIVFLHHSLPKPA